MTSSMPAVAGRRLVLTLDRRVQEAVQGRQTRRRVSGEACGSSSKTAYDVSKRCDEKIGRTGTPWSSRKSPTTDHPAERLVGDLPGGLVQTKSRGTRRCGPPCTPSGDPALRPQFRLLQAEHAHRVRERHVVREAEPRDVVRHRMVGVARRRPCRSAGVSAHTPPSGRRRPRPERVRGAPPPSTPAPDRPRRRTATPEGRWPVLHPPARARAPGRSCGTRGSALFSASQGAAGRESASTAGQRSSAQERGSLKSAYTVTDEADARRKPVQGGNWVENKHSALAAKRRSTQTSLNKSLSKLHVRCSSPSHIVVDRAVRHRGAAIATLTSAPPPRTPCTNTPPRSSARANAVAPPATHVKRAYPANPRDDDPQRSTPERGNDGTAEQPPAASNPWTWSRPISRAMCPKLRFSKPLRSPVRIDAWTSSRGGGDRSTQIAPSATFVG